MRDQWFFRQMIEKPAPDSPEAVIIAALREEQPLLSLPTALDRAERILLRLREAGYGLAPPVPVGWPGEESR